MNSSQKRKLVWIIIGIVILILFMSVAPKRKDLKLSPLRMILPGLYPISTEDMIPERDKLLEDFKENIRIHNENPKTVPPAVDDRCGIGRQDGYVYECSKGGQGGDYGRVCVCEGGSCQEQQVNCKNGCVKGQDGCNNRLIS